MTESYGELCAEFYDLDKPAAPELALAWYAGAMQGRARILEPMCGSGRFLVPLARAGLNVAGFDPSPGMLTRCRARLEAEGLSAQVWQAALGAGAPAQTGFDAAFIPASSFCLLAEPARALTELRAMLAPGGLLLLEFELPHPTVHWPGETTRTVTAGKRQIRLHSRVVYDAASRTENYTNRYELKISGRVVQQEDEVLTLRCYAPDEMRNLVAAAGFSNVAIDHPEFGWVARAQA